MKTKKVQSFGDDKKERKSIFMFRSLLLYIFFMSGLKQTKKEETNHGGKEKNCAPTLKLI